LDNPVILYAYIFTMIGYFLTPFITASTRSEYV
ncbi:ATP synthase subunit I, partial [Vibrio sp. 10N.222.46.A1]